MDDGVFPDAFYNPPFQEHPTCDNNRTSWLRALEYQRDRNYHGVLSSGEEVVSSTSETEGHEVVSSTSETESTTKSSSAFLWWCATQGGSVCANTKGASDPFRNLFYTTNPTLYRREHWITHFASTVAILGDARAIEESITVSYMWRQEPGFTVAFSPGVFRHKRVDRERYGRCESEDG